MKNRALDLIAFSLGLAALCVAVANGCAPVDPLAVCETHAVLAGRCWCLREFAVEPEQLNFRTAHRREDCMALDSEETP